MTSNVDGQDKIDRFLQYGVLFTIAVLLVSLSFLLAVKLSVVLFPFSSGQQVVVDWVQSSLLDQNVIRSAGATQPEIDHLIDVARLFSALDLLIIQELLLLFLLGFTAVFVRTSILRFALKIAGIGGITISSLVGIFSFFFFDLAFELFHQVLFPQGNYSFPMSTYLIQLLPGEFFFQIGILVFVLAIAINVLYLFLSLLLRKKRKRKKI